MTTYTLIGADGQPHQSTVPGTIGGYKPRKIYGRLDCPSALRHLANGHYARHRVFFDDKATAIAAGYPRWWRPDEVGMPHENRPRHGLANTGEYLDGFGNKVYVYAVGNPEVGTKKNRYEKAHQKGSGFGFVTVDVAAKTYKIESFRFLIDPTDGKASNQFPGWPVTLHQRENRGDNILQ